MGQLNKSTVQSYYQNAGDIYDDTKTEAIFNMITDAHNETDSRLTGAVGTGAIQTAQIANGAVTNDKVADGTLTAAKFIPNALTNDTQNGLNIAALQADNTQRGINVRSSPYNVPNNNTDAYAAMNTLLTDIGSTPTTLIFPEGTYKFSTGITFPTTVKLVFQQGANLSPDVGITITINGSIEAGIYQIFAGSGKIAGNIRVMTFYPEWWGAIADNNDTSAATNRAAIQNCIDMAGIEVYTSNPLSLWCSIHFSAGTYAINDELKLPDSTKTNNKRFLFWGAGPLISRIRQTVATKSIFNVDDLGVAGTMNTWRDLGFIGVSNTETTNTSMPAIYGHLTVGVRVQNCWFTGFYHAIDMNVNASNTGSSELYVVNSVFEYCSSAVYGTSFSMALIEGCEFSTGARIETNEYYLNFVSSGNIQVGNCKFNFGVGRGILLDGCTDVQINNCDFSKVGDPSNQAPYGRTNIKITNACNGVKVANCILLTDVAEPVVDISGTSINIDIRGNTFKNSVGEAAIKLSGTNNQVQIKQNIFVRTDYDGILFAGATLVNSNITDNHFGDINVSHKAINCSDNIISNTVTIENNTPKELLCNIEGKYIRTIHINTSVSGSQNLLTILLSLNSTARIRCEIDGTSQGSGSKGYFIEWEINRNSTTTTINVVTTGAAYGDSTDTLTLTLTQSGNDSVLAYNPSSVSGFTGSLNISIYGQLDKITFF